MWAREGYHPGVNTQSCRGKHPSGGRYFRGTGVHQVRTLHKKSQAGAAGVCLETVDGGGLSGHR
jgi:hypothetical protein